MLHRKYTNHSLIHKIIWGILLVVTIVVVICDAALFFQDRAEKKQDAARQTRVIKKRPHKAQSKLVVTHRPKRQKWPQTKQDKQSNHYQAQANQEINKSGVNSQTKQKLLAAFNGLGPNQQRHVLQIINSNMNMQQKKAAIKSYILG